MPCRRSARSPRPTVGAGVQSHGARRGKRRSGGRTADRRRDRRRPRARASSTSPPVSSDSVPSTSTGRSIISGAASSVPTGCPTPSSSRGRSGAARSCTGSRGTSMPPRRPPPTLPVTTVSTAGGASTRSLLRCAPASRWRRGAWGPPTGSRPTRRAPPGARSRPVRWDSCGRPSRTPGRCSATRSARQRAIDEWQRDDPRGGRRTSALVGRGPVRRGRAGRHPWCAARSSRTSVRTPGPISCRSRRPAPMSSSRMRAPGPVSRRAPWRSSLTRTHAAPRFSSGWCSFVPRLAGVACLLAGDHDAAEEWLRRAIVDAEASGAVGELA